MLNIGTGEIIFIAIAALLILGPTKLPEFARTIGKLVRDFRRQTDDVRNVVEREFYKMDQQLQEPPAPLPQPVPDALAHGDFHEALEPGERQQNELPFDESQPASSEALPAADAELSQVMKGAPVGTPVEHSVTPTPALDEPSAPLGEPAPEKV
jgi:sec-independent protein translocase protein TatB